MSLLLELFNISSMSLRRKIIAVVFMKFLWNLLNNRIDCPYLLTKLNIYVPRLNSRNTNFFYISPFNTNLIMKSPVYLLQTNFNLICDTCDICNDSLGSILSKFNF